MAQATTTSIPASRARRTIFSLALAATLVTVALVVLAVPPALAATSIVQDTDREHTQYGTWAFS